MHFGNKCTFGGEKQVAPVPPTIFVPCISPQILEEKIKMYFPLKNDLGRKSEVTIFSYSVEVVPCGEIRSTSP